MIDRRSGRKRGFSSIDPLIPCRVLIVHPGAQSLMERVLTGLSACVYPRLLIRESTPWTK